MGFVRQFEITEGSQRFRRLFRETFQGKNRKKNRDRYIMLSVQIKPFTFIKNHVPLPPPPK